MVSSLCFYFLIEGGNKARNQECWLAERRWRFEWRRKNEIAQECRRMNGLGNPNAKGLAASGSTLDNNCEFTVRQSAWHVFLYVCVPTGAGAKWVKCWNLVRVWLSQMMQV